MSTEENIKLIAKRAEEQKRHFTSEDATKQGLILPFIQQVLGFNIFDLGEVIPEYTADTPAKSGEKVDFALLIGGVVQIIIECKKYNEPLNKKHAEQLFRYFTYTKARIAILTNGRTYQFYSDVDNRNMMDDDPFLTLDLEIEDKHIAKDIAKLTKDSFDIESVVNAASDLKYLNKITEVLARQFDDPSDDFVTMLTNAVYEGRQTQKIKEQFKAIVKKALNRFVTDKVSARLERAVAIERQDVIEIEDEPVLIDNKGIVTTEEEAQAFLIVKAILARVVAPNRVFERDTKSYFGVLLDDNNRQPICRLHFNTVQNYIGIFDADKNEVKHPIEDNSEIYNLADEICEAIKIYE